MLSAAGAVRGESDAAAEEHLSAQRAPAAARLRRRGVPQDHRALGAAAHVGAQGRLGRALQVRDAGTCGALRLCALASDALQTQLSFALYVASGASIERVTRTAAWYSDVTVLVHLQQHQTAELIEELFFRDFLKCDGSFVSLTGNSSRAPTSTVGCACAHRR